MAAQLWQQRCCGCRNGNEHQRQTLVVTTCYKLHAAEGCQELASSAEPLQNGVAATSALSISCTKSSRPRGTVSGGASAAAAAVGALLPSTVLSAFLACCSVTAPLLVTSNMPNTARQQSKMRHHTWQVSAAAAAVDVDFCTVVACRMQSRSTAKHAHPGWLLLKCHCLLHACAAGCRTDM